MPIESSTPIGPAKPVSRIDASAVPLAAGGRAPAKAAATAVQVSDLRDPGPAPVDAERVAEVRKAVEHGTYPLLPTRIADAIIAAGMLLRTAE